INDKSADAHFEAAQDFDRLDQQKEALSHARIATELDPKDPERWFYLGVLERQRANFPAAIQSQTRSIEISESFVALNEREQCERRIGKITEADAVTITFPVAIVAADLIDVGTQPSAFVSEPKLDGTFLWKSQTEGQFTISGVVAGARPRLTLAPGLKDAAGKSFVVKDWSAEYRTAEF